MPNSNIRKAFFVSVAILVGSGGARSGRPVSASAGALNKELGLELKLPFRQSTSLSSITRRRQRRIDASSCKSGGAIPSRCHPRTDAFYKDADTHHPDEPWESVVGRGQ